MRAHRALLVVALVALAGSWTPAVAALHFLERCNPLQEDFSEPECASKIREENQYFVVVIREARAGVCQHALDCHVDPILIVCGGKNPCFIPRDLPRPPPNVTLREVIEAARDLVSRPLLP